MQQKFLSNLVLIVVLNLLVKPFYILGIDAEVQNRVGEAVYGNYFSLLNFSFLLNILLDLGLTNYNARNIARHPHKISNHFGKILAIRFSLFFLYVAATGILSWALGYQGNELYLLLILMINQFFVAIIQFARSNFAGLHLFKTDALISVLDRSLLIVICAALLWGNVLGEEFKIEWFIYAQTLAYGLSALIATGMLFYRIGKVRLTIKKPFTLYILRQSFPYALLILLMMMYSRIDAVMLERLLPNGDEQAGIYAQGFRLLDAVNMFALLFAGLLLPIFARLIRENQKIDDMTGLAFRILFGISTIVAITCFVFQKELIELRYAGSSDSSAITFGYLILSFVPVSIIYVFGTLLTANGSLKRLNQMAFGGVILNIVLNFILISYYGVIGAAIATLVTQGLTALVQMGVAQQIFKFRFGLRYYMTMALLVVGLLAIYYGMTFTTLNWAVQLIILLTSGIGIGFALGIFRLSDVKQVVAKD